MTGNDIFGLVFDSEFENDSAEGLRAFVPNRSKDREDAAAHILSPVPGHNFHKILIACRCQLGAQLEPIYTETYNYRADRERNPLCYGLSYHFMSSSHDRFISPDLIYKTNVQLLIVRINQVRPRVKFCGLAGLTHPVDCSKFRNLGPDSVVQEVHWRN